MISVLGTCLDNCKDTMYNMLPENTAKLVVSRQPISMTRFICLLLVLMNFHSVSAKIQSNVWRDGLAELTGDRAQWQAVSKKIGRGLVTTLLDVINSQESGGLTHVPWQESGACTEDVEQMFSDLKTEMYAMQSKNWGCVLDCNFSIFI